VCFRQLALKQEILLLQELVEWNKKYEKRFGHIFLIFAAGKSSAEILATLRERYVILLIL
jgi:2-oxo-4-hydroxy-4-carboxy--5-ureidoimidazoline (OHCU) decarboxylase